MSTPTRPDRSAGVLLHPTSLPGPFGIGDIGPTAHEWIDVLAAAGQTWWQVLPLGPTGPNDSPYQSFSAFAGNINLLSPELMARDGLLSSDDLTPPGLPAEAVDYDRVILYKDALLAKAWDNYQGGHAPTLRGPFEEFQAKQEWVDDYALFMAIKGRHGGVSWLEWDEDLIRRRPEAMEEARRDLADEVGRQVFGQFLFFRQWDALRQQARSRGIKLIGDVPIFVAGDSAEVWANPHLFLLDETCKPSVVAGVPPDYFSPTGQLWGNPHYNWVAMRNERYAWWVARMKAALAQVDLIRLDHFRGFAAYWQVPAGSPTAETGEWVAGPGAALLAQLRASLNGLPLIAEDLGVITPDVEKLRDDFNLPGMKILQFAWSDPANRFLPHHHSPNSVVYTGTHDNDTTLGWYRTAPDHERHFMHRYLPGIEHDVVWGLIRVAWASVADYALVPLQDLLGLGTEARMNYPGRPEGNWRWRVQTGQVTSILVDALADLTAMYSRTRPGK